MEGSLIGLCRLASRLRAGGMGTVCRAEIAEETAGLAALASEANRESIVICGSLHGKTAQAGPC